MVIARVIPEALPNTPRPLLLFPTSMTDQILATKTRARRQWAARTAVVLGLTGILLVLVMLWRRDTEVKNAWQRSAHRSAVAVQAHLDQTGLLPATLPSAGSLQFSYASYYDRYYAERVSRPVFIAISPTVSLELRPDGRSVIIYENGKVHEAWMTIAEFNAAYFAQMGDQDRFEKERRDRVPRLP